MPYSFAYAVLDGGTLAVLIPPTGNRTVLPYLSWWQILASIDFICPVIGCLFLSIEAILLATKHPNRNRPDRLAFVDIIITNA